MTETIEARAAERLLSGRAWRDFCDTLKLAGGIVERFGDEIDEVDRVDWYRFMTRLIRHGCHRFVENAEPERPRLLDTPWRQGINFQSPDQDHLIADFLDGQHDYKITGNRGSIPYFVMASFTLRLSEDFAAQDSAAKGVEGLTTFDPAMLQTTAFLQSGSIRFDENGDFTVIVSRNRPEQDCDWLQIAPDCAGVLVRTLYHLREETMVPTMRIERLDGGRPRPLQAAEMAGALAKTAQIVLGYGELVRRWFQDNLGKHPNEIRFSRAVYLANGGVADRHHGFGGWECGPDEALVVEFTPTPCDYWILQVCNYWQENLDNYEDGQGYVQKFRARYEADGSVRVVLAREDPGVGGNWVDPFGHVHGGWSLRLINTRGEPPAVTVRRLPLAALKAEGLKALDGVKAIVSGQVED